MKLSLSLVSGIAWLMTGVAGADSSSAANASLSFGRHYAVLNLDLLNVLVEGVKNTTAGQTWINSTATWIDAVHKQSPPPLSIFTRVYYSNPKLPEVAPGSVWAKIAESIGNATESSPQTQLYPEFKPLEGSDVVLQKARYYAGAGNSLEEILSSQKIDTVILSGIAGLGVVLSTAYRLFDLNYRVIVISNNTIDTGPNAKEITSTILEGILPNLPVEVVTVDEAIQALKVSGPAIY